MLINNNRNQNLGIVIKSKYLKNKEIFLLQQNFLVYILEFNNNYLF